MNGNITTSRMGIIGRRFVSVLSFVVTICYFLRWVFGEVGISSGTPAQLRGVRNKDIAGGRTVLLTSLLEHSHIDLLRQHHLLGHHKLTDFLKCREIVHQV